MLQLKVGQHTHRGHKRKQNEDSLSVWLPTTPLLWKKKGALLVMADGMGGHQHGKRASQEAVDGVVQRYLAATTPAVANNLRQAIEEVNSTIHALTADVPARERMGCTLVAAVLRRRELWVANVGDSRAYLWRNGHLRQISRDHSLVAGDNAPLPGTGRGKPGRNVITRALGIKPTVKVDLFFEPLQQYDIVLLCTDGLSSQVDEADTGHTLAHYPPAEAARRLVELANARGGSDNVSVIVAGVVAMPPSGAFDFERLEGRLRRLNFGPLSAVLDFLNLAAWNVFFAQPSWVSLREARFGPLIALAGLLLGLVTLCWCGGLLLAGK